MNSKAPSRSLSLLLVALAAVAGAVFYMNDGGSARADGGSVAPRSSAASSEPMGSPEDALLIPEPILESRPEQTGASTVLWPLQLDLSLIEADFLPSEEGVVGVGSGATASLKGEITDRREQPVRAQVRFVAGTNEGRVLHANAEGFYGASDLYPGISIVEVSGRGIVGSRREVRLRQRQETILNISYSRPATVVGWVQDRQGEPILGARVRVDGIPLECDLDGAFSATNVASGVDVLLEIEHPDYVSKQFVVRLASGRRTQDDQMRFTMERGSSLRLVVNQDIGGPGPVQVYLLPGKTQRSLGSGTAYRTERFPFHTINPIQVSPGRPVEVRGLPPGSLAVHAFRVGAMAKMGFANLSPARDAVHQIRLTTAPRIEGTLTLDGEPVIGQEVRLEAPNRVRATLAYLRKSSGFLETAVMPNFPAAVQVIRSDVEGKFRFTAWDRESKTRYIESRDPEGKTYAGRFLHAGEREVSLELKPIELGDSELALDFPGRFQGLPVELKLNGSPFDPTLVAVDDELVIRDLLAGRWRLQAHWHGTLVLSERELRIEGSASQTIRLIPECIEGQGEEDWLRAGREYPILAQ